MTLFTDKAPKIMVTLLKDFPQWGPEDAAAVLGNIGAETGGFTALQEIKPMVPGSAGGWGWVQWTGPRRRAFEAYVKRNNLDPSSDLANYKYLFVELTGSEKGAVAKTAAAKGLQAKTIAFERNFERAGIKHDDVRFRYAQQALAAYNASDKVTGIIPEETSGPEAPTGTFSPLVITTGISGGVIAAIVAVLRYFGVI